MLMTEVAIRNLCAQFRRLTTPAKGGKVPLDELEALMVDAIERDRSGSVVPDGYPSSTLGGEGGSSRRSASSTERAAVALADPTTRLPADPHREGTIRASYALLDATEALQRWRSEAEAIRCLRLSERPAPLTCEACSGYRGKGGDLPVEHRGTVGDRLGESVDLCAPCYRFVERSASAGTRLGALPTPVQIARHQTYGYWRKRASHDLYE